MRVRHKVWVKVTEDAEGKDVLFGPDDTKAEVALDGFERQSGGLISIAAAGTENLPLGDVAAVKGVYLKVDGDAVIVLNGGADQIQLRKATGASYAKFFIEADITQVAITAPAGSTLKGAYCVWGDVAA